MTMPGSSRRQWPYGFCVLLVAAFPAFYGPVLDWIPGEIVPGIAWRWAIYFAAIHFLALLLIGRHWYANVLTLATLVTLPVVYAGAAVTRLGALLGFIDFNATASGIHYAKLCLTMLTVVPLALALVAMIPFNNFERRLLLRPDGIYPFQKKLLMVLRVFNHTVFFVVPSVVEVLREERSIVRMESIPAGNRKTGGYGWLRFRRLGEVVTYLAVESICAAVQFIPLWAYEIGQLPEPGERRKV